MKMRSCVALGFAFFFTFSLALLGQNENGDFADTVLRQDRQFWDAYNRCDVDAMSQYFWPDVEFYHDKGGTTMGLAALAETFKKNLCGNPASHLRREAVPGTVKVFPLQNNGVIYGAVLSGEHYFYINQTGKPEYRDGIAKFFHVWLLKVGQWKMARVISYDHRPAPYENSRKEVPVPASVLEQYAGNYGSAQHGTFTIVRNGNLLDLKIGDKQIVLHPASPTFFFTTDRDLTFEFVKDGRNVFKVLIREHGALADEAQPR